MNSRILAIAALASAALIGAGAQAAGGGAAVLAGTWVGAIKIGASSLAIVLNVEDQAGTVAATLDSPDQNARGIPVSAISLEGGKLRVESSAIGAILEGILSADGKRIEGTWTQRGQGFPIAMERGEAPAAPKRPQEPKGPFPYTTEEVSILNAKSGFTLAGTLTIPSAGAAGGGPYPALIMVTGSGAQNRDEELLGHKPFLVIADYLARRGIMSLRCDDRGFALSTGDAASATTLDLAEDAEAALDYLASRPEAKKGAVGVLGHSEGGLIGPIVASRNASVGFLVLLAGPGIKGAELLNLQGRAIAKAQGMSDEDIEAAMAINARLYGIAMKAGDESALKAEAKLAFLDWAKGNPALRGLGEADLNVAADRAIGPIFIPWFREFLDLDPAPYLAKVGVPVLALFGSKDLQVPARENMAAMKKALGSAVKGGPSKKSAIVELKGLNHLFQNAKTGSPDEYGAIEETISPEALKRIGDWILGL